MDAAKESLIGLVYDTGLRVHRELGPGLLESVYQTVLAMRLEHMGLKVEREKSVDIIVDGIRFAAAYRVDLFIENWLVVELKATEKLTGIQIRQTLTYVKLLRQPVGLLINFGEEYFKNGARRIINNDLA
jgi:GxxExxY protein